MNKDKNNTWAKETRYAPMESTHNQKKRTGPCVKNNNTKVDQNSGNKNNGEPHALQHLNGFVELGEMISH